MTDDKPDGDLTDSEAVASDDGEPRAEMEVLQKADTGKSRESNSETSDESTENPE